MMKPYEAKVRRSAALLDEKKPGWWDDGEPKKINLAILNLRDCDTCVLGQVWGGVDGFSRAMDELDLWGDDTQAFSTLDRGYPTLTRRWREEILRRRSAE